MAKNPKTKDQSKVESCIMKVGWFCFEKPVYEIRNDKKAKGLIFKSIDFRHKCNYHRGHREKYFFPASYLLWVSLKFHFHFF